MKSDVDNLLRPGAIVKDNSDYRPDKYFEAKCPLLAQLVCLAEYEGKARATATILLFHEDGKSKVRVNNRAQGRVGWMTVDSYEDVFEQIEKALENDTIDWRKDNSNGKFRG